MAHEFTRKLTPAERKRLREQAKKEGPRPVPPELAAKMLEEMDEDDLLMWSMSSRIDFEDEEAATDEEGQEQLAGD